MSSPNTQSIKNLVGFQDKQWEATSTLFNKDCKYLLYGGAAHGGKSYYLRWIAVLLGIYYWREYGITHVPIGLFSKDYPTLKDRQIAKIKREFPPFLGQLRNDQDEGYIFDGAQEYGSFRILLRNLDDPSKYASAEFAAILVEELTENPVETFEDLRFRLRYTDPATKTQINDVKFVGATNPGRIGHAWVKKLWIEPNPADPDGEQDRFFYVPALPTDNKYTTDEYLKQLKAMPEAKRKAWLEGSWDVFEGQVLTEWSRPHHVIKPFKIPDSWHRYVSFDWGVNKPFAVGWYAQNQDGRHVKYRELYMNGQEFENTFNMSLTPKRLARVMLKIMDKAGEDYEYCVADPSIWNSIIWKSGKPNQKDLEEGESIAEIMMDQGLNLIKGDNDRLNGLGRVREALSPAPDGYPWLQVFETCYHTIRTLPSLVYDQHKVEDVDTDSEDHIYDELRYYLMSRPSAPVKVEQPKHNPIRSKYQRLKNYYEQRADDESVIVQ